MAWTSPRTWVAAETVTAALMNTHVRDNLNAIGGTWTSYTPSLTNLTLGNGVLTGAYVAAGKLVHYRIELTFGSTTATPGGSLVFGLPSTPAAAFGVHHPMGTAVMLDTSVPTVVTRQATYNSTAGTIVVRSEAGQAAANGVPWAWATGDTIQIIGTYEAA